MDKVAQWFVFSPFSLTNDHLLTVRPFSFNFYFAFSQMVSFIFSILPLFFRTLIAEHGKIKEMRASLIFFVPSTSCLLL